MLVLELADWRDGRLRFSFVLGPGDDETRANIYQAVLGQVDAGDIKIGRRTSTIKTWKHFSATDVQTGKEYSKAEVNEANAEELGRKVIRKMASFLKD